MMGDFLTVSPSASSLSPLVTGSSLPLLATPATTGQVSWIEGSSLIQASSSPVSLLP